MTLQFQKLSPAQLSKVAIVPQVLDNQWVPRGLLAEMIKKGKALADVEARRKSNVLTEWRRALVYGEQVLVNRAYMFNNAVVVDDYSNSGNRKSFRELINNQVIVPYLFVENSPDERPNFAIREELWKTWIEVITDSSLACVRLDWGDQKEDLDRIAAIFHKYIKNLDTPSQPENLGHHLGVPDNQMEVFKKRIFEVVNFTTHTGREGAFVTRNSLYKKFISAPGSSVDDGKYCNRPYSAELKQVFDLKYNVNIPDAFGRYALTPEDSLPRSVLGDLDIVEKDQITERKVDDILSSLRRIAFEKIAQGLYLKSLNKLSLADVVAIRSTEEWRKYIQSVHQLLDDPLSFPEHASVVYTSFEALNRSITRRMVDNLTAKWEPWIKLVISIGMQAIEMWINPSDPSQKLLSTVGSGAVTTGITPFIMRLAVSALSKRDNADLDLSLDFMRGSIQNGRDTWRAILGQLREAPGYTLLEKSVSNALASHQSSPVEHEV
jgi:hypothetical protein